jgi:Flp pilus assembly protein TadD
VAEPRTATTLRVRPLLAAALLAGLGLLAGCAATPAPEVALADVPPLRLDDREYSVAEALAPPPEDVLALNDEMRAFVAEHTDGIYSPLGRLQSLHSAVKDDDVLDMRYDPFADGDARDAFERRTANCLSYAHLFVALAREAELDAQYQWMEVRPEWHRIGERVAVRLHVNVSVRTRDGATYMIDIDPLQRSEVAGSRLMTDAEGLALYYNNLAMMDLAEQRTVTAWQSVLRGLRAAPHMSQLWVNLGAIYRATGQEAAAEQAYLRALRSDRADRSAMNNLVVLYEAQGRGAEAERWTRRLNHYRNRNPYYHATLGDEAIKQEDWELARKHYARARQLQPDDGQLAYALGVIELRRGRHRAAERLLAEAIDMAAFPHEKERYVLILENIREQQAALRAPPGGHESCGSATIDQNGDVFPSAIAERRCGSRVR